METRPELAGRGRGLRTELPPGLERSRPCHLLAGSDAAGGHEGEKPHAGGSRRRHRPDPASLADPPEPDPVAVDPGKRGDVLEHGERVVRLEPELPAGRLARRSALAAPVEGDDRDAGGRERRVQVLVQVPVLQTGSGTLDSDGAEPAD